MFIKAVSVRALLLAGCAGLAIASSAHAQSVKTVQFDIPAGDLSVAINQIAIQGRQEIAVDAALLRGKRAPALRAALTSREALERLLADTGLQARQVANGGFVVETARPPAEAASPGAAEPTAIGELVVTAQKREQRLLDVPVPVTALSSRAMTQQNLVTLQDLANRVPGLRVSFNRLMNVSLRGVASSNSSPTTGLIVDDVPFVPSVPGAQGILPDFDPGDLARVEVLRGPQGSLYGAAAMGGLIKYVTIDPDPNDFSGRVEAGGNHSAFGDDGYVYRGLVNLPLWEDKLAVRVSGFYRKDPAYLDTFTGTGATRVVRKDMNDSLSKGGRVAVYFSPVESLKINASHMRQTLEAGVINTQVTLTPYPTDFNTVNGYYTSTVGPSDTFNKHKLTQLRAEWSLPFATLTSISGWVRTGGGTDSDSTRSFPFVFTDIYPGSPAGSQARIVNATKTKKFSQEVRLASNGDGPLEWQVGAFYTDEDATLFQDLKAFDPSLKLIGDIATFPNDFTLVEKAVFGSVTYHFNDAFNLQVGGRYSDLAQTSQSFQITAPAAVPSFGPSVTNLENSQSEKPFTWAITPQYRFSDDLMVYGRVATGYRPGGSNGTIAPNPTYDSDTVTNFEVGVKGRLLDRRLTIDASAFDIEWKDIQLSVTSPANLSYLVNGGKARIQGIEAVGELNLDGGWRISGNTALTHGELLRDFPNVPGSALGTIAFKGDQLPGTTRFTANLGLEKTWSVFADYRLTLGGNLSHIGDRAGEFRNRAAPANKRLRLKIPSYEQVDLFATLTNGEWTLNGYIRNVGSKHGLIRADDSGGRVAATSGAFIAPQTVGLNLARNF